MIKFILYCFVLLLLGGLVYFALVPDKEAALEKGSIDQMTDQAADEIVDSIRVPIEKARDLKKKEDERVQKIDENIKKMLD